MTLQITKPTNLLRGVQDAFRGLVFAKHEEAGYAFPCLLFLSSFDESNGTPSLIMQALNILVVFLLAVVLPMTWFKVPGFWNLYLRSLADAGLAVVRAFAVRGAQETPDAMWDTVAFDDSLELASSLKGRDHASLAIEPAGQSVESIQPNARAIGTHSLRKASGTKV